MPNEPPPPVSLEVSSEFKRNLRVLAKRYRSIRSDLEPVLAQLQAGECPGDQIAGIDAHPTTALMLASGAVGNSPVSIKAESPLGSFMVGGIYRLVPGRLQGCHLYRADGWGYWSD